MQLKAIPLIEQLFSEVNPIPVKKAVNLMGMECGGVRKPLMNLTDADKQVVAHCCELINAAYAREELA